MRHLSFDRRSRCPSGRHWRSRAASSRESPRLRSSTCPSLRGSSFASSRHVRLQATAQVLLGREGGDRKIGDVAGKRCSSSHCRRVSGSRLLITWPSPGSHFPANDSASSVRYHQSALLASGEPRIGPATLTTETTCCPRCGKIGQELQDVDGALRIADQHDAGAGRDARRLEGFGDLPGVVFRARSAADHHGLNLHALRREALDSVREWDRVEAHGSRRRLR